MHYSNGIFNCLWDPDVVEGKDGRYYLYYCLDVLPVIGVAVCDTPVEEYQYLGLVRQPDGTPLGCKANDYIQFDPGVFIDDDDSIYLYSGNGPRLINDLWQNKNSQVMKLEDDMITLKVAPRTLIPILGDSSGTSFAGHEFYEASSVRKIEGKHYFIYSDVNSYTLCYAISHFPDRGYVYGGCIIALGDIGYQGCTCEEARNFLGNTHGSIELIDGQWYVFYHRQTNRTPYSRQACAEKIKINADKSISQVEMTSCGMNGKPLKGHGEYPAVIACNLWSAVGTVVSRSENMDKRFPYFSQKGADESKEAEPYIANMRDGSTAGYKYFYFENTKHISVKIRGTAQGTVRLLIGDAKVCLGELTISLCTNEWVEFSTLIQEVYGTKALYI